MSNTSLIKNDGRLALSMRDIKEKYGIRSERQIMFAMEYVFDPRRNAARAYAKVYRNSSTTAKTDTSSAVRLTDPDSPTGRFINDLDSSTANLILSRGLIQKEHVLQELIKLGFADAGNLYDDNGNILAIQDMPLDVTPAIRKIKEKVVSRKIDEDTGQEETVLSREIEMHDKKGALQLIGQHLQMFVQKGEIEVKTTVQDLVKDITANNAANRKSLLPKDNIDDFDDAIEVKE